MNFSGPGLKTGVENGIFWSEIGSGFGEPGGTPLPRIPRCTPLPPGREARSGSSNEQDSVSGNAGPLVDGGDTFRKVNQELSARFNLPRTRVGNGKE